MNLNPEKTYIIAELSCNHGNDLEIAKRTIVAMKESGADAVKLQTSRPSSLTIDSDNPDFVIKGNTLWDNRTLFNLYQETYTPWEWHSELQKLAKENDLDFFSSPFDFKAVDFLESLNVNIYKIASFEITDIPLIKYVASKKKPIIISTGIAEYDDIMDAVNACRGEGNNSITLLKCTSAYPTPWEEVNLSLIPKLKEDFNCIVGLSDHTPGSIVPLGAVALGAKIIEKHFILDRNIGGPDAKFSMEPDEFRDMVDKIRILEKTIGNPTYKLSDKIKLGKQFARSLYIVQDVKMGDEITNENVRSIRPGYGMKPKYLELLLGKKFNADFEKGTRMTEDKVQK